MAKLESKIQSEILKHLRTYKKSFTYKHEPSPTGIPDIHFIHKGKSIWFEVKRSSKHKPSKIQKKQHKRLRKAGCKVFVVWSKHQVVDVLTNLYEH